MIKNVSYLVAVLPKDVVRRQRAILNNTSQVDATADVDVNFWSAQNDGLGSCNRIIDM